METVLAFVVGGLSAAGFYLMLRRSLVKLIIGLGLLSHAFNLLIFTVGGLDRGRPPLIPIEGGADPAATANPLPQALVLTAIVIGFAVQAFAMVLIYRTVQAVGSEDANHAEEVGGDAPADAAPAA